MENDVFETDQKVTKNRRRDRQTSVCCQQQHTENAHRIRIAWNRIHRPILTAQLTLQTVETFFISSFFPSFVRSFVRCLLSFLSLHFMSLCFVLKLDLGRPFCMKEREGDFPPSSLPPPVLSRLRLDVRSLGRYLSLLVIVIVLASASASFCWREVR